MALRLQTRATIHREAAVSRDWPLFDVSLARVADLRRLDDRPPESQAPCVVLDARAPEIRDIVARLRQRGGGVPVFVVGSFAAGTHHRLAALARAGVDDVFFRDAPDEDARASTLLARVGMLAHLDGGVVLPGAPPSGSISVIRQWIERNASGDLSVRSVAEFFQMTSRNLERLFAQERLPSPSDLIRSAVLKRARALRDATGMPWRTIATCLALSPSALAMRRRRAATA